MSAYRRCPVCRQKVGTPTIRFNIRNHFDSIGRDECPGSGLPFDVAPEGGYDEHLRKTTAAARVSQSKLERLERLVS